MIRRLTLSLLLGFCAPAYADSLTASLPPILTTPNTWSGVQTMPGLSITSTNSITLGGFNFANNNAGYNLIQDVSGNNAVQLGSGANYLNNTQHVFRNAGGTTTFGSIDVNGWHLLKLATAPTTAPGAGNTSLFVVAGTNSGTCKLQMLAGTSTTPVTIFDNVGAGC